MPSDWIWIQCNHFEKAANASMMISVARIPWLTGHFPGFLSFATIGEGKVYRFATYNNSKIVDLKITESTVQLVLENKEHRMEITANRNISGQLKAPVHGKMDRKIAESLDAEIEIRILTRSGNILFEDKGKHTGLEVVGDISRYI
ncbi:MAG: tocopherol cyclase family protein, partial [Bacteroidales bacterium]|jgi:tocopherol cyclase|nr:tocopherol cyclase family protein [Bacteroidales bacterium]